MISPCPWCRSGYLSCSFLFFFNDTATTEIYTLSLHDALPISDRRRRSRGPDETLDNVFHGMLREANRELARLRSEEHTSELQSLTNLVCRLLLEKKKKTTTLPATPISKRTSGSKTRGVAMSTR